MCLRPILRIPLSPFRIIRAPTSFETPSGRFLVKPGQYVEMISSMKPNMWVTLSDEVPAWVSEKRNKASIDRTMRWLDDCLKLAITNNTGGAEFGSVVGGSKIDERKRCAQEVSKRNVSGFHIGGFGLGESMDEHPAVLNAVTRKFCKVLLLALTYLTPRMYTILHLEALHLHFLRRKIERHGCSNQLSDNDVSNDGTKINLKATIYRKDTSPILEGCKCYTCQNHTKAYINHLFNVHEMLAQILLEIHNTHHYLGFFRKIRDAIEKGTFEEFRQNFVETRRDRNFAADADAVAVAVAMCA